MAAYSYPAMGNLFKRFAFDQPRLFRNANLNDGRGLKAVISKNKYFTLFDLQSIKN